MINNPQIFVIFEPGMFGTFFCSLFMKQKLWSGGKLNGDFDGDDQYVNAHKSGYQCMLRNFHENAHYESLLEKSHDELIDFFSPLQTVKLGVHRLASYSFINLDFKKYFNNFAILLIKPRTRRIDAYGKRMEDATVKDFQTQWWWKNLKRKDLGNIPPWFFEKLSVKEKRKYLMTQSDMLDKNLILPKKNIISFDPDDITDPDLVQETTDRVCNSLNIDTFEIPFDSVQKFIEKNNRYFNLKSIDK